MSFWPNLPNITSLSLCPLLLVSPESVIAGVEWLSMQLFSFCVGNSLNLTDLLYARTLEIKEYDYK